MQIRRHVFPSLLSPFPISLRQRTRQKHSVGIRRINPRNETPGVSRKFHGRPSGLDVVVSN